MPFKKINEKLISNLAEIGITDPNPFQKTTISKLKSGADLFLISEKQSGKTTASLIAIINKLSKKPSDEAPRGLIIVPDKASAIKMEELTISLIKDLDLFIVTIFEEADIDDQRDALFRGCDLVITTPKRLSKVYFLNGINLNKLEMFVIDDTSIFKNNTTYREIERLTLSLKKCQIVLHFNNEEKKVAQLQESYMERAIIVR